MKETLTKELVEHEKKVADALTHLKGEKKIGKISMPNSEEKVFAHNHLDGSSAKGIVFPGKNFR